MGPHSSTAPMGWCSGLVSAHSPVVSRLFLKVLPLIEQAREEHHYWGQQSDHFSTRQPGLRDPSIYLSCLGTSALGPGALETMRPRITELSHSLTPPTGRFGALGVCKIIASATWTERQDHFRRPKYCHLGIDQSNQKNSIPLGLTSCWERERTQEKVKGRDSAGLLISCPFLSGESPTYNRFSSDPGSGHLATWRTDEGTGKDPQGPTGSSATGYRQANETANSKCT